MVTEEQVREVLKQCYDPELNMDIITLELVYSITITKDNVVNIRMTFTTPACPYGPLLLDDINNKVKAIKGVKDVKIDLVFDPPWQPSEELRAIFGI